jgi:hypothetical protein
VSAVPEEFTRDPRERAAQEDSSSQVFWQWFAVGMLLFAWIAEATLCALRGF